MSESGSISINDSSFSLDSILESLATTQEEKESLRDGQIVILPNSTQNESLVFSEEAVPFYKYCTIAKEDDRVLLIPDENRQVLALRSIDFFMPVIYIAKDVLLPALINLVSSYIYDRIRGQKENPNVKLKVVIDESKTEIDYDGPLSGLPEVENIVKIGKGN